MPGMILAADSKARLEKLRVQRPEAFASRAVWVGVMHLFDTYTFKLASRRDVTKMFSVDAKKKVSA